MKDVYGYARISKDEDKKNYGSIETQKNMINDFARENGWKVEKIFIDDDISGYIPIEDRPAFNELYELVNNLKPKPIILMKDWSRLSRNNGIAQTILNKWKDEEVELILIKEMGAPFNLLTDNDDIVGITTWINERYVKETSRKVRDALNDRLKNGTYVSGPRYGYIKGKNGVLTVNEEVREAIVTIYNLYEEGFGMNAIAKKLNTEYDFKNPSIIEAERFKRERGRNIRRNVREYWEKDMIMKILEDKTYIGTLVTHKKEVIGIHGKKVKILDKKENYNFENHHEAIISKEQFDRVQKQREQRTKTLSFYQRGKYYYIFGGFVKCGECGASYTGAFEKGKIQYRCLNYRNYGRLRCTYNMVSEKYILDNLKSLLKDLKLEYLDILNNMNIEDIKRKSKSNQEKLEKKLDRVKQEYKTMQSQKIKELVASNTEKEKELIEETYSDLIVEKSNEIQEIENAITKIKNENNREKIKNFKSAVEYFDDIIDSDSPSKQVLSQVLDKIIITKGKNLEFKLKLNIDEML